MIQQSSYRKLFKIVFEHSFFDGKACGLTLEPTDNTVQIFQKEGLIFKPVNSFEWIVIFNDEIQFKKNLNLSFQIKIIDILFLAFTSSIECNNCTIIDVDNSPFWKLLNIELNHNLLNSKEVETFEIILKSPCKFLEYLVIPNEDFTLDHMEIREQNDLIRFSQQQEILLPGTDKKVYRFVSTEPIQLKYQSDFQFNLWTLCNKKDKIISKLPEFNNVELHSPFSPKDTLTNYFEF